jgi:hypothetical protein
MIKAKPEILATDGRPASNEFECEACGEWIHEIEAEECETCSSGCCSLCSPESVCAECRE